MTRRDTLDQLHRAYAGVSPTLYPSLPLSQQVLLCDDALFTMQTEDLGVDEVVRVLLARVEAGGNWGGLLGYSEALRAQAERNDRLAAIRATKTVPV